MILVDTSIWIDHLRHGNDELVELLETNNILAHPFITGELACGSLKNHDRLIAHLQRLPQAVVASDPEVLAFIKVHRLMGRGVGYVDAHLLASVHLSAGARLWTRDRKLAGIAAEQAISR